MSKPAGGWTDLLRRLDFVTARLWVPAIAISGLSIYNGDAFPAWKGHVFVGAMRANTGQHIQRVWFNRKASRSAGRSSSPS